MSDQGQGNTGASANGKQKEDPKEAEMLAKAESSMNEMKGAMGDMMHAYGKFMQAFIDMRLGYLKAMRTGIEDPTTAISIMTKNFEDTAKALREAERKSE